MLLIGASTLAFPPSARAAGDRPGVEACASASEAAQNLLDGHRLLAAREKLLVCTQTSCPAVIKRDCDELLSRADLAIPSIVLSVKDARGRDVTDARVLLDGALLANALQGRALPLDPGPHTVRLERTGSTPVEIPVVAHEGERDREVPVQLGGLAEPSRSEQTVAAATPSRATPWGAWVLGGVGVVGLGTFIVLAANGQHQYDQCENVGCPASESSALERQRAIGIVSLGVGVLASAGSVWLFVKARSRRRADTTRLGIAVTGSGASLRLGGSF
jgi:hypothetical protein